MRTGSVHVFGLRVEARGRGEKTSCKSSFDLKKPFSVDTSFLFFYLKFFILMRAMN